MSHQSLVYCYIQVGLSISLQRLFDEFILNLRFFLALFTQEFIFDTIKQIYLPSPFNQLSDHPQCYDF